MASILVQLGEEGFGIPVLEGYAKGCVVVFAGVQPAAEMLNTKGVIKLSEISIEALRNTLLTLSIDNYHVLRNAHKAIDSRILPTWGNFVEKVELFFR